MLNLTLFKIMGTFVLLSLEAFKQQKFDQMAAKIMDDPDSYLAFDSVSDFYPLERKTSGFSPRI